ncbi:hypothetical protein GCM10027423_41720 [Spirosoma arcticum]
MPDHGGDSSQVPSGMDNDPHADEEVINQQAGEQYPEPVEESTQSSDSPKLAPDNLADSIAYALDGSGPGPTNDTPNVSGHKVITEGTTGHGPDDEEDALRA